MTSDPFATRISRQPRSGTDRERNREILAERGHWPPGALAAVRELEQRNPGWYAWWTARPWRRDGKVPNGPAFGAAPVNGRRPDSLYAETPGELARLIHESIEEDRRLYPWRYRQLGG
jgi:hypothetical protein